MLYGEHATCQAEAEYPELWSGLVGAWSPCLSPRGGTVLRDLSGRQNHGTLTSMDPSVDWVTSNGSLALNFPTSNDIVTLPSWTSTRYTGDFTLLATFSPNGTTGLRSIVRMDGSVGFCGILVDAGTLATGIYGYLNDGVNRTIGVTAYSAGALYHAAFVNRGGVWTFYVNGASKGSGTHATNANAVTDSIGNYVNVTQSSLSKIFDVSAHKKAMTQNDIALHFRLGPGGWATPRRRRWNYATAQTAIPYWVFARKNARLIGGGVS